MKTIKVIDLLNMIANGEEVPKKIKYLNSIYTLRSNNNYYEENSDSTHSSGLYYQMIGGSRLNDEVEIIEKNKKIEKLDTSKYFYVGSFNENQPKPYDIDVFNKINEIINYINKEGGNNDMFS